MTAIVFFNKFEEIIIYLAKMDQKYIDTTLCDMLFLKIYDKTTNN